MDRGFWILMLGFFALIVAVIVATVFAGHGFEKACIERGGWFTYIGGYPSCLPPGAK